LGHCCNGHDGSCRIFIWSKDNLTNISPAKNTQIISIKDTGIGIQKEDIPNSFDRFKKTGDTNGEGYGLGLSIVKTIADYHNYILNVTDMHGEGAEFNIIIPV
jgi:two-component system sensor histidine kinase ArlS